MPPQKHKLPPRKISLEKHIPYFLNKNKRKHVIFWGFINPSIEKTLSGIKWLTFANVCVGFQNKYWQELCNQNNKLIAAQIHGFCPCQAVFSQILQHNLASLSRDFKSAVVNSVKTFLNNLRRVCLHKKKQLAGPKHAPPPTNESTQIQRRTMDEEMWEKTCCLVPS